MVIRKHDKYVVYLVQINSIQVPSTQYMNKYGGVVNLINLDPRSCPEVDYTGQGGDKVYLPETTIYIGNMVKCTENSFRI